MSCRFLSQRFNNGDRESGACFAVPLAFDSQPVGETAALSTANFFTFGFIGAERSR